MNTHHEREPGRVSPFVYLLLALSVLLPWAVVFFWPTQRFPAAVVFWLLSVISFAAIWLYISARQRSKEAAVEVDPGPYMLDPLEQPRAVKEVMDVRIGIEENGAQMFRGPLRVSPEIAFEHLRDNTPANTLPMIQEDDCFDARILMIPKPEPMRRQAAALSRPWVHWTLLALTFITTTIAGAAHRGLNVFTDSGGVWVGLPYSIGLMLILGVHELGHYVFARKHHMNVSLPYFIPVPFALGTFGAFIRMKSPPENRRMLFEVSIAGPLAGLLVAIPAVLIGLHDSTIITRSDIASGMLGGTQVNSSILFGLLAKLSLGKGIGNESALMLGPLAFAGWLGLFITALNLLPVGQLDGGHIARAVFGGRVGERVSSIAMWSIVLLAVFLWPGLILWALLIFFIAGRGSPPLNDVTPLSPKQRALGYFAFLILILILAPLPASFWN